MKLYLMRHGHAENVGAGTSDHDRQLTSRGFQRISTAARVLSSLDVTPDHIYSSPRIRARQTAEIVGAALKVPVEIREEVNFGFNISSIKSLTATLENGASVLFVGHEPSMSVTLGEITGADVAMKKGGFARIDLLDRVEMQGELVWLIAPSVFDALTASV